MTTHFTPVGDLIYVTTENCHLCEHGRAVLDELGIQRREILVTSEEATNLAGRGVAMSFMPVLTDGHRVVAYGRFSAKRLRRDLEIT